MELDTLEMKQPWLSTTAFILMGKVYGNLMVDLKASNKKLVDRAKRLVKHATGVDDEEAARVLDLADGHVKLAILIEKSGLDAEAAKAVLDRCSGRLREAIAACAE